MKQFILVLMLVIIASSETVKPSADTICACDKIKSQVDCTNMQTCAWTAAVAATDTTLAVAGSCGTPTTPTTPTSPPAHCPQVTEPATNCWKTLGCAYIDSKCTHFTGCTAYVKTTNSDCQAISNLCITDGTQCTDAKSCNEYTLETQCTTNASISGNSKCKWDNNACRDYVCTEADTTLATNAACSAWLSGCVTTGKGCIATLQACASYSGDDVACSGLKGTDGNCQGTVGGTNCTARVCSQAASTVVTDSDCATYQVGCITNGKGCVASPLPGCATYLGDNTSCIGFLGSDGTCEGDAGATNCRSRTCTNAPASNNTDALCAAYRTGCVTTGKGCVSSRGACAGYSGTTTSCEGYIGSDGKCKGSNATSSSPCSAKVCTEALTTTATDAACASYQTGCKTTGKGCIAVLGLCSSYTGTITTCEGMIGQDGKCKGTSADTPGSCSLKVCTDAPTSTSTNEACAAYQTGCVTTGAGCVNLVSCQSTIKSISCTGTSGCGWNNICVASQYCSDFLTVSICNGNNAILVSGSTTTTTPCFWTGSVCRSLACTDAPNTYNTDPLCNTFLAGCVTKGNGCLAPTAACSSFFGSKTTCQGFTAKCTNTDLAGTTTACIDRQCIDDSQSTTNSACDSYLPGCRTKGTGCIEPTKLCSDYTGTQAECDNFMGNSGTNRCWNASPTGSANCINKACSHLASATSDSDCGTFLSGCLFNGIGCTEKANSCTSYTGTQTQCGNFKGVNQTVQCWSNTPSSGQCTVKSCGQAPITTTTNGDCETFLTGCLTNGAGCVSKTSPCSSYSGNITTCEGFLGNSKKCSNKDSCTERLCADKQSTALGGTSPGTTNTECSTYLSSCRYFNGGCVNAGLCTSYTGDSLAKCQDVLDSNNQKCWWKTGGTTCISRACADAPTVTSQTGCTNFLSTCEFNGSICQDQGICASYTAFGTDDIAKQSNCGQKKSSVTNKYCWFVTGQSTCTDRTCANALSPTGKTSCDTHIGDSTSCWWNGTSCQGTTACASYTTSGLNDAAKLAICQAIKDNTTPTSVACYWTTGSNCVSKSCSNVPSPSGQSSCESHFPTKCAWNGSNCVDLGTCNSYSPNASSDDATKKIICEVLSNTLSKKCTFITGMSTCTDRTCSNITTVPSATECSNWLSTCYWNGKFCEPSQACSAYTPFGATLSARAAICGNIKDSTTTLNCTQLSYTAPTTCAAPDCTTISSPSSLADCTNYRQVCRWQGSGTCINAGPCSSYIVSTGREIAECQALTDSYGVKCGWPGSGVNCYSSKCTGKQNATNQSDCTAFNSDCRYVGVGTCVIKAACNYSVSTLANNAEKKTACENALAIDGTTNCAFIPGATMCTPRATCSAYAGNSITICQAIVDMNGNPCTWTSGSNCEVGCVNKTNATNQADCTAFNADCRYVGVSTCVPKANCDYSVSGTNAANKTACENALAVDGTTKCAYIPGDALCRPRAACSTYVGNSVEICKATVDTNGNSCDWQTGETICKNSECTYKTNATNQADCSAQGADCRYVGVATCVAKDYCNYLVSSLSSDTAKKAACENALDIDGTTKCAFIPGDATCTPRAACSSYSGANLAICEKIVDKNGNSCTWVSGSNCSGALCTNKTNATNQADCTAFNPDCRYVGVGTCVTQAACNYSVSSLVNDEAKKTACENALAVDGTTKCAFLPGASVCIPRAVCASYAGTSATICQAMVDSNGKACGWTSGSICAVGACSDKINAISQDDCTAQVDSATCKYVGVGTCVAVKPLCTEYIVSTLATDALRQSVCLLLAGSTGLKACSWVSGNTCVEKTCETRLTPTSNADCQAWLLNCTFTGTFCIDAAAACSEYYPTGTEAQKRAKCQGILDTAGNYCSFIDGASNCSDATACSSYSISSFTTATTDLAIYDQCRVLKNTLGNACEAQFPKCEAKTCANITPAPASQTDCTSWKSSCRFTGNVCVEAIACTYILTGDYATATKSGDLKKALCNNLEDISSTSSTKVYCTLTAPAETGTVCIPRTCGNVYPTPTTDTDCVNWLSTCTLHGSTCETATACGSYTLTGADNTAKGVECRLLRNASGTKCEFSSANACENRACTNAPTPSSDTDCSSYLDTCTISNAATPVCLLKTSECTQFSGLPNQCQSFTRNSKKCWSVSGASTSAPALCKVKECTDNSTATTNDECNSFLPGCKTSGLGCVESSVPCTTFFGNSSTCATFKTTDGTNLCRVGTATADPCNDKACSDDASSTTNEQCKSFMSTCLTKGTGCIDSDAPCSKYQGTQAICQNFVGAGKKCWNLTSVTNVSTYCVDKKCSDDDSSTTNAACESSLTGCLTKGTGCIENTAACGSYQGTQSACSAFKGSNGTKLCWNAATATDTTPCTEKACSDNTTATSDADCETFLPKASGATDPKCVTNGAGCVDYPRSCSGFTGTSEKCGTFKASDGPCKTTATGSITASGTCAPRVCAEALNSLNTDTLCSTYHPSCVTTGYGCVVSVACSTIQEKNSCSAKVGCSWVNNCRSINADCQSLTTHGASICVNTPVSTGSKKCSWYNGTTCRAQTCDDLPATLVSHDSCKAVITTCTTTGSGCITIGNCSAYLTEVICKVAKTTQAGDTCIWDTNACRAKKCTDAPTGTTTDAGCDTYLTGCKTNGTSCVASVTCSTLLTAAACQVDGLNKPCLYVNNTCYSYAKCEDATMITHSACQSFSPLCTTSGDKCIAITSCAKTVLQLSCVVGTDGSCGWLPANGANAAKCQKFGACSDAAGADNASCAAYGSNCITDGTKCIDKGTCSTYLTQPSCDYGGTDGACQFTSTSNSCRLRECTDATATNTSGGITSHSGCYGFTAKTKCTTNGTSCIQLEACASYTVEAGCFEGTDGLCVYDFPVGQTAGTKACRVKVCGDFKLTTSAACSVALTGAGILTGCVSDSTNCIVKAACSSYTSKEACNGGGQDGLCAFTPGSTTTPTVGTCKLMTACTDANSDSAACNAKSSVCNWQVSTSGTTTCDAHTCTSKATGSICNPVPNYDGVSYTVCGPATTGGCTEVTGSTLLATTCQSHTLKTYTWNETTSTCTACFTSTTTDPVTNNGGGGTTTDGNIIKSIATLVILAILVA